MSRSHAHWIQDNILNSAILAQALSPVQVFETLGSDFCFYGSVPRLLTDWRWYKSVTGKVDVENTLFLDAFERNSHNFTDYRHIRPPREAGANRKLEHAADDLYAVMPMVEGAGPDMFEEHAAPHLRTISTELAEVALETAKGLDEALALLCRDSLGAEDVAGAGSFAGLFGREMCYLSLTRLR